MPSFMTQVAAAKKIKQLPKARKGAASKGTGFRYDLKVVVELSPEQKAASKAASDADKARREAVRTARRDEKRFVDGCVEFLRVRVDAALDDYIAVDEYTLRNLDALVGIHYRIHEIGDRIVTENRVTSREEFEYLMTGKLGEEALAVERGIVWPEGNESYGNEVLDDIAQVAAIRATQPRGAAPLREIVKRIAQEEISYMDKAKAMAVPKYRAIAVAWREYTKRGKPCNGEAKLPELPEHSDTRDATRVLCAQWNAILEWHESMAIVKRESTVL
jgi:hypothetical protein